MLRAAPAPFDGGRGGRGGPSTPRHQHEQRRELDVMYLRIYEVDVLIHDTTDPDRRGCD
ncbi:hypothetical protein GCM10010350_72050 [Streptomyces galilaeus]|nr:hypothetical protein GCM10010350_72050 [Streptomyces galilaeus]